MLLRFLRARQFKVTAAWELLEADIKWREQIDVNTLREKTAEQVLGIPDVKPLFQYLPSWIQGMDKQGRPVIIKRFGKCAS